MGRTATANKMSVTVTAKRYHKVKKERDESQIKIDELTKELEQTNADWQEKYDNMERERDAAKKRQHELTKELRKLKGLSETEGEWITWLDSIKTPLEAGSFQEEATKTTPWLDGWKVKELAALSVECLHTGQKASDTKGSRTSLVGTLKTKPLEITIVNLSKVTKLEMVDSHFSSGKFTSEPAGAIEPGESHTFGVSSKDGRAKTGVKGGIAFAVCDIGENRQDVSIEEKGQEEENADESVKEETAEENAAEEKEQAEEKDVDTAEQSNENTEADKEHNVKEEEEKEKGDEPNGEKKEKEKAKENKKKRFSMKREKKNKPAPQKEDAKEEAAAEEGEKAEEPVADETPKEEEQAAEEPKDDEEKADIDAAKQEMAEDEPPEDTKPSEDTAGKDEADGNEQTTPEKKKKKRFSLRKQKKPKDNKAVEETEEKAADEADAPTENTPEPEAEPEQTEKEVEVEAEPEQTEEIAEQSEKGEEEQAPAAEVNGNGNYFICTFENPLAGVQKAKSSKSQSKDILPVLKKMKTGSPSKHPHGGHYKDGKRHFVYIWKDSELEW